LADGDGDGIQSIKRRESLWANEWVPKCFLASGPMKQTEPLWENEWVPSSLLRGDQLTYRRLRRLSRGSHSSKRLCGQSSGLGTASVGETNGARADCFSEGNMVGAGMAPTGEAEGSSVSKMVGLAVVVGANWVGTATSVGSVVGPAVAPTTGEAEGSSVGKWSPLQWLAPGWHRLAKRRDAWSAKWSSPTWLLALDKMGSAPTWVLVRNGGDCYFCRQKCFLALGPITITTTTTDRIRSIDGAVGIGRCECQVFGLPEKDWII
jgi:hypothetical protein